MNRETHPQRMEALARRQWANQTLLDSDLMPFGAHKGRRMEDVPARYLHWLWCNGKKKDLSCPVAHYIRRNLAALKKEHPDGIW